jgi:hypothetical protein
MQAAHAQPAAHPLVIPGVVMLQLATDRARVAGLVAEVKDAKEDGDLAQQVRPSPLPLCYRMVAVFRCGQAYWLSSSDRTDNSDLTWPAARHGAALVVSGSWAGLGRGYLI